MKNNHSWFLNIYICPECGEEWDDEWESACDDICPYCGARDISPVKSEPIVSDEEDSGLVDFFGI